MKRNYFLKIRLPSLALILCLMSIHPIVKEFPEKDFYQIKIYRFTNETQLLQLDAYFKDAFIPAAHRAGIKRIGIFKPIANDTSLLKSVYVFIPFFSEKEFFSLDERLRKDHEYMEASKSFREAPAAHPPYDRMESVLLESFNGQKHFISPEKKQGMVFELRSYESPTEKLQDKKIAMFENAEIDLFKRLDFKTVFYAKVISGNRMPNFMYMPSFESLDERNLHWKIFGSDPQWKAISSDPVNENNVSVSRIESILMRAADYSEI
jgi:hypothetical protein